MLPDYDHLEEQQFHRHDGNQVPVLTLYSDHDWFPDKSQVMGHLCDVCGFTWAPATVAWRLKCLQDMYQVDDT